MKKILICLTLLLLLTGCSNKKVESFLTEGLITLSSGIDEGYPAGYVFNKDGTFSYFVGEFVSLPKDSLVSCRGTWKVKNNTLILTVEEDEHNINPDDIWDELDKNNDKYEIKYENIKLEKKKGVEYLKTDQGKLYSLNINKDYMQILYSLSKSYDDFYKEKNKYYESI